VVTRGAFRRAATASHEEGGRDDRGQQEAPASQAAHRTTAEGDRGAMETQFSFQLLIVLSVS